MRKKLKKIKQMIRRTIFILDILFLLFCISAKAEEQVDWEQWIENWENRKHDMTQLAICPGKDDTQLNFCWYSKGSDTKLLFGTKQEAEHIKVYLPSQEKAQEKMPNGEKYLSNKVTIEGLTENTNYQYWYEVDGVLRGPFEYRSPDREQFAFLIVGDPQIGASNPFRNASDSKGEKLQDFLKAQEEAVRKDSFLWNQTLQKAYAQNKKKLAFVLSVGDQIQQMERKAAGQSSFYSELEYTGFLMSDLLRNLPVAVTIGNHDADNENFSWHFYMPNLSEKGKTEAGGDSYFIYGTTLFYILNSGSEDIEGHRQFMREVSEKNPNALWRIAVFHHDIYGAGYHVAEEEIKELREDLVPILEENQVDLVLSGHDHMYARSYLIKAGDWKKEKIQSKEELIIEEGKGILYLSMGSSSGSKYYSALEQIPDYIAAYWQENIPTYSRILVSDISLTIDTYRTDTGKQIDQTIKIVKKEKQENKKYIPYIIGAALLIMLILKMKRAKG